MADQVTADVKLSSPVLMLRTDYAPHVTELAGRIVKQEGKKLYVLVEREEFVFEWMEVKDAE